MSYNVQLTLKSRNVKTGPIPVSTTTRTTCPDTCPFKNNGCYAESGPLAIHWKKVTQGKGNNVLNLSEFFAKIRELPEGQTWRHNQAGDLFGEGESIDHGAMMGLVSANMGRNGFTYTHKPLTGKGDKSLVMYATQNGFTINLSGNDLAHADTLADYNIAPVTVVLPHDVTGNQTLRTPKGRKVVICPATYRDDISCASCKLCAKPYRDSIVGFPAHGTSKKKASAIAATTNATQGS
jgi:hypothetical protein